VTKLALARPLAEPGIALMAQIYKRVVVNLPATFRVVS
jgi:hypothetical protein